MPSGTVIKRFGAFKVTDDGSYSNLYGVWADMSNGSERLIGSGMKRDNAIMVAEALDKVRAGTSSTLLTESGTGIA